MTKGLLNGSALLALAGPAILVSPALAAGTPAGTVITNEVTVQYAVNGITQDDETASDQVTVDRKVDLVVARTDNSATVVTPGAVSQAVSFTVENTSNATLDFALLASQRTSGASAGISGTDSFDAEAPFTFFVDDGNGVFDGGDNGVTHLEALSPDLPVTVHLVATRIPTGIANNAIAGVVLTATARENNNGTAVGSALTEASTNTAGVDTIFADGAGATDSSRDAAFSAIDDYTVFTATITAAKTSRIVSGSFGTGAAIPGSVIEYCIAISNAAGAATATGITISDPLPAEVTFDAAYGVKVGGPDCDTPGTDNGGESGGTVSGTIASLPGGTTRTLIFQATIN